MVLSLGDESAQIGQFSAWPARRERGSIVANEAFLSARCLYSTALPKMVAPIGCHDCALISIANSAGLLD